MQYLWPGALALIGLLALLRGLERLLLSDATRNGVVLLLGGLLLCGLALRRWQDLDRPGAEDPPDEKPG